MPHLQFETTADPTDDERRAFLEATTELYADHMDTGTGHVAVTLRVLDPFEFSLGRLDPGEPALMLNADIRAGRTFDQKRGFVLAAFDAASDHLGVPAPNAYAVVTEHVGEEFHEHDRVLSGWDASEATEGAD